MNKYFVFLFTHCLAASDNWTVSCLLYPRKKKERKKQMEGGKRKGKLRKTDTKRQKMRMTGEFERYLVIRPGVL